MHTLIGLYNPSTNASAYWSPQKIARGLVANSETAGVVNTNFLQYPYTVYRDRRTPAAPTPTRPALQYSTFQEFYELQSPDPDLYPNAELAVPD